MFDFTSGDLIRMSKPGAPGFEEKRVSSFDGELLIFENGKRLNVNEMGDWIIEKIDTYVLRTPGGEFNITGEFALYLRGQPPEVVAENATGEVLSNGVLLVKGSEGELISLTRVMRDATSGP